MTTTQATARTRVFNIIGENEGGTVFDSTFVNTLLDEVEFEICAGHILGPQGERVKAGNLEFLFTKTFQTGYTPITLTQNVLTTDIIITVQDTTNIPTSGIIEIERDIITYTGVTSTTLTGVTGINIKHTAGEQINFIFAYPSNILNEPDIFLGKNENRTPYQDNKGLKGVLEYWTDIIDINGNKYIKVIGQKNDIPITIIYQKAPVGIATLNTIPDNYYQKTVCNVVAGRLLQERGEISEGAKHESEGIRQIKTMYNYYKSKNIGFRPEIYTEKNRTLKI